MEKINCPTNNGNTTGAVFSYSARLASSSVHQGASLEQSRSQTVTPALQAQTLAFISQTIPEERANLWPLSFLLCKQGTLFHRIGMQFNSASCEIHTGQRHKKKLLLSMLLSKELKMNQMAFYGKTSSIICVKVSGTLALSSRTSGGMSTCALLGTFIT